MILVLLSCSHTGQVGERNPSATFGDEAKAFTGSSNYRLFFARYPENDFDPSMDITQKTRSEIVRETMGDKAEAALVKTVAPVLDMVSGNRPFDGVDFITQAGLSIAELTQEVRSTLIDIKNRNSAEDRRAFPIVEDFYFVPWISDQKDLYHSSEKVSAYARSAPEIFWVDPRSERFSNHLTKSVKETFVRYLELRKQDPVVFLGMTHNLYVSPYEKSYLRLRILLGLRPNSNIPFVQKNDDVHIKRIVIPQIEDRGPVVSLYFKVDMSIQNPDPVTLTVELGDFENYSDYNFNVSPKAKGSKSPRLEGMVNRKGAKWVGIDFAFDKLDFAVEKLELERLTTKTRLGFDYLLPFFRRTKENGSTTTSYGIEDVKWRAGNFSIKMVDEEFTKEVNANLKQVKDKAANDVLEDMFGKGVDLDVIKKAFMAMMGRG